MNEAQYKTKLSNKIRALLPWCIVLRNDANLIPGIPDILVLYNDTWGMLEAKTSLDSPLQPNQEHYIDVLNDMSFASFICPENEEVVLYDLQQSLGAVR
jgi:hypothetical protein